MKHPSIIIHVLWTLVPVLALAQSSSFTVNHNKVELVRTVSSSPSGLEFEVGVPVVTTGDTVLRVPLVRPYWRVHQDVYYAGIWHFLESTPFVTKDGPAQIVFDWGFRGFRMDQYLKQDSILNIQYQLVDVDANQVIATAFQAILNSNSILFDSMSQQSVKGFILLGQRKFTFNAVAGQTLMTRTTVNVTALVDSSLLIWRIGGSSYIFKDSATYWSLFPFVQVSLPSVVQNFTVSVAGDPARPSSVQLAQNYPNPFNPTTTIDFALPSPQRAQLKLFDALGRQVAVLADGYFHQGSNRVLFNANSLTSGVYFYSLLTSNGVVSRKLLVLK